MREHDRATIVQAPCVVKEFPTKLDLIATFIITIGCVLSVAFADHQTITYSLDSMIRALYKPVFVLWMLMVITGMSVAYYLIRGGQQPGVGGAMTRIEESVAGWSLPPRPPLPPCHLPAPPCTVLF